MKCHRCNFVITEDRPSIWVDALLGGSICGRVNGAIVFHSPEPVTGQPAPPTPLKVFKLAYCEKCGGLFLVDTDTPPATAVCQRCERVTNPADHTRKPQPIPRRDLEAAANKIADGKTDSVLEPRAYAAWEFAETLLQLLEHYGAAQPLTPPQPPLAKVLREHWLFEVVCNHETRMDVSHCACSRFECPPQPTIGEAVDRWVEHVMEQARAAPPSLTAPLADLFALFCESHQDTTLGSANVNDGCPLCVVAKRAEVAEKEAEDWKHEHNMYRSAWLREIGGQIRNKHHEIDGFVLTTRELKEKADKYDRQAAPKCKFCGEPEKSNAHTYMGRDDHTFVAEPAASLTAEELAPLRVSAREWMARTGEYATELRADVGEGIYNQILIVMDEFAEHIAKLALPGIKVVRG